MDDQSHLFSFPIDGFPGEKLDATNLNIGQCVVFFIIVLSDRETGCFLFYASKVIAEASSECTSSFPNVQRGTAATRDTVHQITGQAVEVPFDGEEVIRAMNSNRSIHMFAFATSGTAT